MESKDLDHRLWMHTLNRSGRGGRLLVVRTYVSLSVMLWFQFVRGKLDFRQRATNKTNSLQLYFLHNFWSRTIYNIMLCWEQNFLVHQKYLVLHVGIQIHVHNLIWHIRPIPMACVANISSPSFHWNKVGKADDARLLCWAEYFIRRSNIKHRQFG